MSAKSLKNILNKENIIQKANLGSKIRYKIIKAYSRTKTIKKTLIKRSYY